MNDVLFIVNPKSGSGKKDNFPAIINKAFENIDLGYKIVYTEYKGHAFEIAREHFNTFKSIVAVGGDGTINEVSKALVKKETLFGIVPLGSGNGLARTLGIPLNPSKAIETIIEQKNIKIDTGTVNGHHFINVAGIGFDARVAHEFDKSPKRGLKTYIKTALKEFLKFKPEKVILALDGLSNSSHYPFIISIANSSQWGNDFHISPKSSLQDGLLDICIIKKFPMILSPIMALRLKMKTIHKSNFMETISCEKCSIIAEHSIKGHVDGEPVTFDKTLNIAVIKEAINIIV